MRKRWRAFSSGRSEAMPSPSIFEIIAAGTTRTEDVSPSAGTLSVCKLLTSLSYSRNRAQETEPGRHCQRIRSNNPVASGVTHGATRRRAARRPAVNTASRRHAAASRTDQVNRQRFLVAAGAPNPRGRRDRVKGSCHSSVELKVGILVGADSPSVVRRLGPTREAANDQRWIPASYATDPGSPRTPRRMTRRSGRSGATQLEGRSRPEVADRRWEKRIGTPSCPRSSFIRRERTSSNARVRARRAPPGPSLRHAP
jgi:hypothetical protein